MEGEWVITARRAKELTEAVVTEEGLCRAIFKEIESRATARHYDAYIVIDYQNPDMLHRILEEVEFLGYTAYLKTRRGTHVLYIHWHNRRS
jgi:hypothetical protein